MRPQPARLPPASDAGKKRSQLTRQNGRCRMKAPCGNSGLQSF